MKVVVDFDECASNAVCMGILPEVFEVRDDGYLYILNENPPEEFRDRLREAVNGCPTGAISRQSFRPRECACMCSCRRRVGSVGRSRRQDGAGRA